MKPPIDTVFEEHELLIWDLIHKFRKRRNVDIDELRSSAYESFCIAYDIWDTQYKFTTCLVRVVNHRFLDLTMNAAKQNDRFKNDVIEDIPEQRSAFKLGEWVEALSSDAQDVVDMVLNMPDDIREQARRKGPSPAHVRCLLKKILNTECGWKQSRIQRVWTEIQGSL